MLSMNSTADDVTERLPQTSIPGFPGTVLEAALRDLLHSEQGQRLTITKCRSSNGQWAFRVTVEKF